ncbi:hypothetical protein BSU04_04745 [Caballeronia sordidicola]|uniref:Uncharacterized protein n=1 Tax=Caballeronia sordidicola TaxID=196367 RepID=A0A226X9Q4_CABSO|nr:hypothetical protein BSU04_04745 [Caballeronia sordidicola]
MIFRGQAFIYSEFHQKTCSIAAQTFAFPHEINSPDRRLGKAL